MNQIQIMIISFLIYGLILLAISWVSHKRSQNTDDFLLGGRSVSYWVTALSAHASDMSIWLFLGLPLAINNDLLEASTCIGLLLGMALSWKYVAPRLRLLSEKTNSITLSDFFAKRVKDETRLISTTISTLSTFFFIFYIASGLKGMSIIFSSFNIDPIFYGISNENLVLLISTILIITYTVIGGFLTVAMTDAFQAIFLLIVIVAVPVVAFVTQDLNISSFTDKAFSGNTSISDFSWDKALINTIGWGLGYLGMPHILTKFMGIKNPGDIKKSMYLGLSWQFIALSASVFIGLLGRVLYQNIYNTDEDLFIRMVFDCFPIAAHGFIMCGVLAATISTVDSQIIVSATSISKDLINPRSKEKQILYSRVAIASITSLAALIVYIQPQINVHEIVRYAWSGLGSTIGPLMLCSLYYTKTKKWGAFAGIISGASVSAIFPLTGVDYPPLLPGFLVGLFVIIIGSKIER